MALGILILLDLLSVGGWTKKKTPPQVQPKLFYDSVFPLTIAKCVSSSTLNSAAVFLIV